MHKIISCLFFSLFMFLSTAHAAENTEMMPGFTSDDRVIVFAPHPDDESIGTAGVILKALKAGAKIKVVLFTSGENNEFSFIVYEKRITLRKGEFLHMGKVRREETMAAMAKLGVKKEDVILLGYPDFGTMEILLRYWDNARPYKSMLAKVNKVPYPDALSPGAAFCGQSVLTDLKTVISSFSPSKIFVAHPADSNRDHRALYVFLKIALWDLGVSQEPELYPYLIHVLKWPRPRGFHGMLRLEPPDTFKQSGIEWKELGLTDEEVELKKNAIASYRSQILYNPPYLFSFARRNELFGDYQNIRLTNSGSTQPNWVSTSLENEGDYVRPDVSLLSYALHDEFLLVRLTLKRKFDRKRGRLTVNLLGYSRYRGFSQMPKIRIYLGLLGLRVYDKKQAISARDIRVTNRGREIVLSIPRAVLGSPDRIISFVNTNRKDLPYDDTAWRILELE